MFWGWNKMKRYKVTGKFCILNKKGEEIKQDVFINKIVIENDSRSALELAIKKMTEKFTKKYEVEVELKQVSNVLVKCI